MTQGNVQTNCTPREIVVTSTTSLPYSYIPYSSVAHARINHPCETLYVYNGKAPAGYQIVAFPVLMKKPEKNQEGVEVADD